MANIKSNKKRHIQDNKKYVLNHAKLSECRTMVKKTKLSKNPDDLSRTYAVVDKAAKNKRMHRNKANRIKSRTAINIRTN